MTGADRWHALPANEMGPGAGGLLAGRPVAGGRVAGAAVGGDSKIRLWEVASGKVRHEFSGRFGPVISLAFSPDGAVWPPGARIRPFCCRTRRAPNRRKGTGKRAEGRRVGRTFGRPRSADAAAAGRAVARLGRAAADAAPYLKQRVRPVENKAVDGAGIVKLVAEFDGTTSRYGRKPSRN